MRKFRLFIIIMFLLFIVSFECFAASATYNENLKTSLDIEGFVAVYFKVNVTELDYNEKLEYGMPFDITSTKVQYNGTDKNLGWLIAKWSFASTQSPVNVKITASPMEFDTNPTITLDYYISFKYKYALYTKNGDFDKDVVGYILADSEEPSEPVTLSNSSTDFPIVVSTEQDIRFMFKDGVNPSADTYPAGYYSATVTIEFTSGS